MASIDGLPPLREVINRHGLEAKKAFGQNFLLDLNLTQKIALAGGPLDDCIVLEIGPGPGGLTRALLANGVKKVVAIERDSRCLPALAEISSHYPGRLDIVEGDALTVDIEELTKARDIRIVANLPYNIGTQLLINWLLCDPWPPYYQSMTLMFQKEVGQRIVALPGSASYGRLGVLAGWRADSHLAFDIAPRAFTPPPKVTSSVVQITPRPSPIPCNAANLSKVTRAAFGQRRKMLRQSLKPLGGEQLLNVCGIDPTRRAETLEIQEFCILANALE